MKVLSQFVRLEIVDDNAIINSSEKSPSSAFPQKLSYTISQNTYKVFFLANLLGAKLPQKHDRVFLLCWTDSEFIMPVAACNIELQEAGRDQ